MTAKERYAKLVDYFVTKPGVTQEGKGFGSESLRIGGWVNWSGLATLLDEVAGQVPPTLCSRAFGQPLSSRSASR